MAMTMPRSSWRSAMAMAAVMVVLASSTTGASGQLRMGFYDQTCPGVERMVGDFVRQHVGRVPTVAAALLRLHFHDCFVRGCDASVLLNSTAAGVEEKDTPPNLTLRGFDFVDRVKALVEEACPGVVSCADVLALSARDAVAAIGGPSWRVPTGRRDGTVSSMQEALNEIPGAGNDTTDPSLDAAYAVNLRRRKCRAPSGGYAEDAVVEMDPGSHLTFDLGYYRAMVKHRCLLQSDAALLTDPAARADVEGVVGGPDEVFFQVFARSMARMSTVQVKTGAEGEIRRNCAVVNSPSN